VAPGEWKEREGAATEAGGDIEKEKVVNVTDQCFPKRGYQGVPPPR